MEIAPLIVAGAVVFALPAALRVVGWIDERLKQTLETPMTDTRHDTQAPLSAEQLAELDPGIRDLVVRLNAAGFVTTDSGDGTSKPKDWFESGDALPYPHVFCKAKAESMISEAHRALQLVQDAGWLVEVNYRANDGSAVLSIWKDAPTR